MRSLSIRKVDYTLQGTNFIQNENLATNFSMFIYSCDGTIKFVEKPLESDANSTILQQDNKEIEALFVDDNLLFYCGESLFYFCNYKASCQI